MRPREFIEEDVLTTAFTLICRKGIQRTSLVEVAQACGLARSSLYNAFGTKEALFLEGYRRYLANYLKRTEAALSSGPLRERLERYLDLAIERLTEDLGVTCPTTRGLMELTTSDRGGLPPEAQETFAEIILCVQGQLEAAFEDGKRCGEFHGDPARAAEIMLSVVRGLVILDAAFGDTKQLLRIGNGVISLLLQESAGPVLEADVPV